MRSTGESWLADNIEISDYNVLLGAINSEKITKNNELPFDS